jgi:hypothetical protein
LENFWKFLENFWKFLPKLTPRARSRWDRASSVILGCPKICSFQKISENFQKIWRFWKIWKFGIFAQTDTGCEISVRSRTQCQFGLPPKSAHFRKFQKIFRKSWDFEKFRKGLPHNFWWILPAHFLTPFWPKIRI